MKRAFGFPDPFQDARRVRTAQLYSEAISQSGFPGTFALENKIYLWPADGGAISTFDADQAGLIAALAAAVSGDTVWLPSIPIALTAGVTVPAGAVLIGISDNAALSFSGFSGAAVTLSADSTVYGISITMVSNGVDAIGVDARASASRAEHLTITVSGGSTRNIRVLSGVNATSSVVEIWTIQGETTIAWAETTGLVGDTPAWNTIALPAAFTKPDLATSYTQSLQIDHLGHYLYIGGRDSTNGLRGTVWQLTNLAAIRAAPATAPSWAVIAYSTQVVSAGTLSASTLINSFYIRCFGDSLYLRAANSAGANTILGIYNGSSWTWRNGVGGDADKSYQAVFGDVYAALNLTAGTSYLRDWLTDASIGSFGQKFGIDHFSEIWRRFDAPNYYTHPIVKTGDTVWLHEATTSTETSISNSGTNPQDAATVRGAYTSDAVYSVDAAGDLRVSSDGLTYSNVATWAKGWAMNTIIDGSGDLLWMVKSQTDTNPVVRLYDTAGTLLDDLTGDLWDTLGHPGGTIEFAQMLLVYSESAPATGLPIIADLHAGSATGTGAADVLIDGEAIILDADLDVIQVDSGTAYVRDVSYTTHNGAGAIEPQWGDRGVWDVDGYPVRHASDIDGATFDYHNDPANPPLSQALTDGHIFVGDASNIAADVAMSGDATIVNTGALTLKNTGPGATGPLGGATVAPIITIDAQGRVTALTSTTITGVTPAAHQLDGVLHTVSGLTPGDVLTALTASTFGFTALATSGEVLMADGVTPPDPLTTEDETDWLYEG